jgi:hypothetical protein
MVSGAIPVFPLLSVVSGGISTTWITSGDSLDLERFFRLLICVTWEVLVLLLGLSGSF